MNTYEEVISTFIHSALPVLKVSDCVHFESVVAEVIGSKKRRQGPMPSPEVQVAIRDYIRSNKELNFFIPWSGSKTREGSKVDVLDLMAIKHLACLKESLAKLGVHSRFHFRLEDITDYYLCPGRENDVVEYCNTMEGLTRLILNGEPVYESSKIELPLLKAKADGYADVFYSYLTGGCQVDTLKSIGWQGEIPQEQRDYYYTAYKEFYPGQDHARLLAEYFAVTLARNVMGMHCLPNVPVIQISFTRPVPKTPTGRNRLYYRTIPEQYTCKHSAPWVRDGYFEIHEDNTCCPKYIDRDTDLSQLIDTTLDFDGVKIHAPYILK